MDDLVGVADSSMVGDEILIVRAGEGVTDDQLAAFRAELDAIVARHGMTFKIIVVRARDRVRCAGVLPAQPVTTTECRQQPRQWQYPVC